VWDLAIGPDGLLYAAVGPNAAVHRIDRKTGRAEKFFEIDENHVVCLAFDEAGNLLLGTEGKGLVVRVTPDGIARALHDCPQGEVRAVLAGGDGVVWTAASATSEAREQSERPDHSDSADGSGPEPEPEFLFEVTAPPPAEAVLFRIDSEGNAIRHWESSEGAIFDLALVPTGDVLAATGEDGAIFKVHADGAATLVLDTEEDHVVAFSSPDADGAYFVATGNPSRLLHVSPNQRKMGSFKSQVLDAGKVSRWGRFEWQGEKGEGRVRLAVRAGNTGEPDGTWSEWTEGSALSPRESRDLSELGRARFLQWRLDLEGDHDETPMVRQVRVSSLENNLPPLVTEVRVVPAGNRYYEDVPELRPRPLYQELPGGAKVQYSYEQGQDEELPPAQRAPWTQGLRQVQWEANDPNGDNLIFELSFRREDESRWKVFAEDIEGENFTFNANGVPDGAYRIRVVASDRRFNPNDAKEAGKETEIFLVDNTAPGFSELVHKREGPKVEITGVLADDMSDVVRLEFSVNGDDWIDEPPADGIFDSLREGIDFKVEAPPGEEHSVILRGTDLAGNLGSARVLIQP
jgi:hypothetical protein